MQAKFLRSILVSGAVFTGSTSPGQVQESQPGEHSQIPLGRVPAPQTIESLTVDTVPEICQSAKTRYDEAIKVLNGAYQKTVDVAASELAKATKEWEAKKSEAAKQYVVKLEELSKAAKSAGDLDSVLALEKEKKRFTDGGPVNAENLPAGVKAEWNEYNKKIAQLKSAFNSGAEREFEKVVTAATSDFISKSGEAKKSLQAALQELEKTETQADRIPSALIVRKYRESVQFLEASPIPVNVKGMQKNCAPAFEGRFGQARDALVKKNGGNERSEMAVARGLAWLARQQRPNGSWVYEDGTQKDDTCSATALALLPFLAAGQSHIPGNGNTYQQTVSKGLDYLLSLQNPTTGQFKNASQQYMYAHAIASLALCELYGMTGDKKKVLYPAKAAINFIVKSQSTNGSWGYRPNTEGDTSIVGWQVQALRSAELCRDIPFPKTVYEKTCKFLDSVSGNGLTKSTYGYRDGPGQPGTALTAIGLLCRSYMDGWDPVHPGMVDGVDGLIKRSAPADGARYNIYYFYYATQAVRYHGEDAWFKEWNPKMRDLLIQKQVRPDQPKALSGSWDKDSTLMGSSTGRHGTTCLSLLTLQVYYRYSTVNPANAEIKDKGR